MNTKTTPELFGMQGSMAFPLGPAGDVEKGSAPDDRTRIACRRVGRKVDAAGAKCLEAPSVCIA